MPPGTRLSPPPRFELSADEAAAVRATVEGLAGRIDSCDDQRLYRLAPLAARELPHRMAEFLHAFRSREPAGGCVIGGWHVEDAELGPTPQHWRRPGTASPALVHEVYLVLLASVLGEVYSWGTVQDGSLVQDLLPVRGQELEKNAGSSASLLDLHNEDAFSDLRCDYLALMCLRNDDRVPTSYASMQDVALPDRVRGILAEPRFLLLPDPDHLRMAAERGEQPPEPTRTAVLFGDPTEPYVVMDEYFIETEPGDGEARSALATLVEHLRAAQQEVALSPGQVLVLDNYRAVHGRRPFLARYDGRDRWLKRLSITRDLRKSRAHRGGPESRIIGDAMRLRADH